MNFFRYLSTGSTKSPEYLRQKYDELLNAMDLVGFSVEVRDSLVDAYELI